ncbi:MAG: histidine phosphatase family protein, partial [Actinomycetes bacterium]
MTRQVILWMRHGTSVDGLQRPTAHARPDTPLSDQGRVEVHRATAALAKFEVGRVLSSPLPRAWET